LSFHFNVLKPLTTTEKIPHHLIWAFRDKVKYFPWKKTDWKIVHLTLSHPKKIDKEVKLLINDFNNKIKKTEKDKIEAIVKFILINLVLIHPFDNWNWKVFWILLDVLLWKYDFFPLFVQNNTFKPKLLEILSKYSSSQNFDKLVEDFYELIIYIYFNYKV
jgi:fido (protein-threonine AMPylation protein)